MIIGVRRRNKSAIVRVPLGKKTETENKNMHKKKAKAVQKLRIC